MNRKKLFILIGFTVFSLLLLKGVKAIDISDCAVLDQTGETYYVTTDFTGTTGHYLTPCIDMTSSASVTLDCQGHTISGSNMIYLVETGGTGTKKIKNCILRHSMGYPIYSFAHANLVLENTTARGSIEYGIKMEAVWSGTFTNITTRSNGWAGILFSSDSRQITITNMVSISDGYGIDMTSSTRDCTIKDSIIKRSDTASLRPRGDSNLFYNNLLNSTTNVVSPGSNQWNTTKQVGTRTYSSGSYIGGNYWTNPTGNGFSDTCADTDEDGFCDSAYTIDSNNIDYLPLSDEYKAKEISTCSVLDQAWATYYLTADIIDSSASQCMQITADNIVLDCQWHTIDGIDSGTGISGFGRTNTIIRNCAVTDWETGIYFFLGAGGHTLENLIVNSNNGGGVRLFGDSNTMTNVTANFNTQDGISLTQSDSNTIINAITNSNGRDGIQMDIDSDSNTVKDSIIQNNGRWGLQATGGGSGANSVYNNFFNNTSNAHTLYNWDWNTTKQFGARVYSSGTQIGGNYWTTPSGNGFSDTCTDADEDGFCDSTYSIYDSTDHLPLSDEYKKPPRYFDNSANSTLAGSAVEFRLNWTDNVELSGYIFQFCNGFWNGTHCSRRVTVQLQLQDDVTDNLGDTIITDCDPGSNYGSITTLINLQSWACTEHSLIKFNITSIPADATIENADLGLYLWLNDITDDDAGFNVSAHHHYNLTWEETYPTWVNIGDLGPYNSTWADSIKFDESYPIGWYYWDVGNTISNAYSSEDDNVTFYLITHDYWGDVPMIGRTYFWSKEYGDDTTLRPYLNITYTESGWVNDTWTNDGGAFTGTEAWSNVTKVINDTVGATIKWRFFANDTNNNWNASEMFTLTTTSGTSSLTPTTIQAGATVNPVTQYQNTTIWCDYRNATDNTEIIDATVKINIEGSNITIPYNLTSNRYDYVYNSTTAGTKQVFCYAERIGYDANYISFNLVTTSISPGECGWACDEWGDYMGDDTWLIGEFKNSTFDSNVFGTCNLAGCEKTYWFRKYITPPPSVSNVKLVISYWKNLTIYINGNKILENPGWYTANYDITSHIRKGARNLISIKVAVFNMDGDGTFGGDIVYE